MPKSARRSWAKARVYAEDHIRTNCRAGVETGAQRNGVEVVIHELILLDGHHEQGGDTARERQCRSRRGTSLLEKCV